MAVPSGSRLLTYFASLTAVGAYFPFGNDPGHYHWRLKAQGERTLRPASGAWLSPASEVLTIRTRLGLPLQHKATHICVQCKNCQNTKVLPCNPGIGGATIPRTCDANPTPAMGAGPGSDCGVDPYNVLPHRCDACPLR